MEQKDQQSGTFNLGTEIKNLNDPLLSNDGSGKVWQVGWYVYQDGKIQGPLGLMEALSRPYFGQDQQAVLISRRGYNQWYDLSLLAPLLDPIAEKKSTKTEKSGNGPQDGGLDRTRSSPAHLTKFNVGSSDIFESHNSPVSALNKKSMVSKEDHTRDGAPLGDISKRIFKTTRHPSLTPSLVKPVLPAFRRSEIGISVLEDEGPVSQTAADISYKDFKPALEPSLQTPITFKSKNLEKSNEIRKDRPVKWVPPPGEPTQGEVIQEYFISRQKLRLGSLRSLALYGWIGFFASGGLIWGVWVGQIVREIQNHSFGKPKTPWYVFVFSQIPMIHFFYIYFLSNQIIAMEKQNRYRTISMPLALLFGLFPPICLCYLQKAVNNHWLLHAKSALLKKS